MGSDLLIVDSLSHGPLVWDEALEESSRRRLAEGVSPFKVAEEITLELVQRLIADDAYFAAYVDAWRQSGVRCVSWTVGVIHARPYSLEAAYHNYAYMTQLLDARRDFLIKVTCAADIERARTEDKRGILFNFQNLDHIGTDLALLDRFHQMGFRIMQLTYNMRNAIGCGCTEAEDSGLSDFGLAVVERMNDLGILVDVSHCGLRTSKEAALRSRTPIACTHTFARTVCAHDRGKDDDVLQTIAGRGGYIGVLAVPGFLTEKPETTVDDFLDHLDYIVDRVGIDHVGLGTDFFGFSLPESLARGIDSAMGGLGFRPEHRASFVQKLVGFEDYVRFPNLIAGLERRGYEGDAIQKLAAENFLRVLGEVIG